MKKFILLLITLTLCLSSCEKEEIKPFDKAETTESKFAINYVSGEKIPDIITKLNPNYSFKSKNSSAKSSTLSDSYGNISLENILETIDTLGNKKYSFILSPKKPKPNSIFNLVIDASNNNLDMAIIEYRMAPNFAQDYHDGTKTMAEFTGSILTFPYKAVSGLFSKSSANTCVQNIDDVVNCDKINVSNGAMMGSVTGGSGSSTIDDISTYTGGNTETVVSNNSYGEGSAYWVCHAFNVAHTGPTGCGDGSGTWIITLPSKRTNKGTSCCDEAYINGSIGVNTLSSEAIAQAIEDQIDDSQLDPCLQKVLSKLKLLKNGVGQTIVNFAGNTTNLNWNLKSGDLNGTSSGETNPKYDKTSGSVTTTFDSQRWTDATDLSWARTMLHESIHAYLAAQFAISKPNFISTYPAMVSEWDKLQNWNDIHHEEIARSIVNDVAIALEEYGSNNGYNLPKQFYQDMAWGGLQETSTFKKLPFNEQQRILDVIATEFTGADTNGNVKPQKGKKAGC